MSMQLTPTPRTGFANELLGASALVLIAAFALIAFAVSPLGTLGAFFIALGVYTHHGSTDRSAFSEFVWRVSVGLSVIGMVALLIRFT